jgi:DNA-binding HxlR family transcriptional regulator
MTEDPATERRRLPLEAALDRVGDRWSLLLVEALLDGSRRFGDLGEALRTS